MLSSFRLSIFKRQTAVGGTVKLEEMHFAGPVPDEDDYSTMPEDLGAPMVTTAFNFLGLTASHGRTPPGIRTK